MPKYIRENLNLVQKIRIYALDAVIIFSVLGGVACIIAFLLTLI